MLVCSIIHEADSVRRLAEKSTTSSAADFAKWSQAIGFRHEPDGVLIDPTLDTVVKPASQFVHDWMHAIFVHGVFNTVSYLMTEACLQDGFRDIWDALCEYVATYVWPARVGSSTLKDTSCRKQMKPEGQTPEVLSQRRPLVICCRWPFLNDHRPEFWEVHCRDRCIQRPLRCHRLHGGGCHRLG